jgi:hypothetical protein
MSSREKGLGSSVLSAEDIENNMGPTRPDTIARRTWKDESERSVLEKEIAQVKMALDLLT